MRKDVLSATIKLAVYLAVPLLLWAMPREEIMSGDTICLFSNIIGRECWGCGFTRAAYLAMHGEFSAAWELNRLIVVTLPLLAFLWLRGITREARRIAGRK
jgi:hypothetical protein